MKSWRCKFAESIINWLTFWDLQVFSRLWTSWFVCRTSCKQTQQTAVLQIVQYIDNNSDGWLEHFESLEDLIGVLARLLKQLFFTKTEELYSVIWKNFVQKIFPKRKVTKTKSSNSSSFSIFGLLLIRHHWQCLPSSGSNEPMRS